MQTLHWATPPPQTFWPIRRALAGFTRTHAMRTLRLTAASAAPETSWCCSSRAAWPLCWGVNKCILGSIDDCRTYFFLTIVLNLFWLTCYLKTGSFVFRNHCHANTFQNQYSMALIMVEKLFIAWSLRGQDESVLQWTLRRCFPVKTWTLDKCVLRRIYPLLYP